MTNPNPAYVHGYSEVEEERLLDQAQTLSHLLHHDTHYAAGTSILEAGCGVGAQTVILATQNPEARFTAVDISPQSLAMARTRAAAAACRNVTFQQADLRRLAYADETYDHVFLCFVLEHLKHPESALQELSRVLKPGGTVTVIEGDHGSAYFHPASPQAQRNIDCLVALQAGLGGNALVGRELYPLLRRAGFRDIRTEPRVVYADASRPDWVEGFTKATFIAMVRGVKEQAIQAGMLEESEWDEGIRHLERTATDEGTFNYTFFKAIGRKRA
jgi:SAM-dependent methyltransferase